MSAISSNISSNISPNISLTVLSHHTTTNIPYQHLHIRITTPDGLIAPADLKALTIPDTTLWSQGVVIEGKAPVWLYAYLVHACRIAAWVATFDPRLGQSDSDAVPHAGGAVVVATHSQQVQVGQVLSIQLPDVLYSA